MQYNDKIMDDTSFPIFYSCLCWWPFSTFLKMETASLSHRTFSYITEEGHPHYKLIESLSILQSSKYCFGIGSIVSDWLHYRHCFVGIIEDIGSRLEDQPYDRNYIFFYLNVLRDSLSVNGYLKTNQLKTFTRAYSSMRPDLELWTFYECFLTRKSEEIHSGEREHIVKQSHDLCHQISKSLQSEMAEIAPELRYLDLKASYRFKTLPMETWIEQALDLATSASVNPQMYAWAKNILLVTETLAAKHHDLLRLMTKVDECWICIVVAVLENAQLRQQCRTSIAPSTLHGSNQMRLLSELDFLMEDDLPIKISAKDGRVNCPLEEPNKKYSDVKACYLALEQVTLGDDSKMRLFELLAYFDELRLQPNKWARQSKWHRKRYKIAQKCKPLEAEHREKDTHSLKRLSSVCYDMVNCKTKLFEHSGGQLNGKLLQKMTFYGATGIKANARILDYENITSDERVETLSLMGRFYSKLFSPDKDEQMSFAKKAIDTFSTLIELCKSDAALRKRHNETYLQCLDTKDMLERQIKMHSNAKL